MSENPENFIIDLSRTKRNLKNIPNQVEKSVLVQKNFKKVSPITFEKESISSDLMSLNEKINIDFNSNKNLDLNLNNFIVDTEEPFITQTIGVGSTAVGRVISYDQTTGVLKYWQDRTLAGFNTVGVAVTNPTYGFDLTEFTSSPSTGGSLTIVPSSGSNLAIDTSFTGISTVINSRTYYLGQEFTNGLANPEVKKYSGNIIYVDNRPAITRSSNQKEDIKVILQF